MRDCLNTFRRLSSTSPASWLLFRDSDISEMEMERLTDKSLYCQSIFFVVNIFNNITISCGRIPLWVLIQRRWFFVLKSQTANKLITGPGSLYNVLPKKLKEKYKKIIALNGEVILHQLMKSILVIIRCSGTSSCSLLSVV